MADPEPNEGLELLYRETGWTLRQFAQEVNRLGMERGTPLRYREPSVHQWLKGHLPKENVRSLVLEALARRLRRPVTYNEAGFPAASAGRQPDHPSTVEGLLDLGRQDMDPSR
ncbi:tetratricopeptide repeat protein, partial [Streptomyces sp. SID2131]|nr:tetratricopeptide repeat protein [Streptomyces sp. SID2131]